MRRKVTIAYLSAMAWVLMIPPADAGYDELKKAYDEYAPPSYWVQEEILRSESGKPSPESDFDTEKKRIQGVIARWEQSLRVDEGYPVFFRPAPSLLRSLEKVKGDEMAASAILGEDFSLETLEAVTILRNPGIMAAESRFRAAIEGIRQVTALDEILQRYSAFTEGVMTGVGPMKGKDSIKTKFPFPGVLSLKAEIAEQEVIIAREALEKARRDAVTSTRKSFWKLLYNREAQRITAKTLGLLKYLEEVARVRYEAGKTSFQDVIKVRIEREILADRLITLKELRRNIETRIRETLNLPPDVRLGSALNQAPRKEIANFTKLNNLALERKQELRQLRAKIGKMERAVEMAETMIFPPFSLGLSFNEDNAVTDVGTIATKETFPVSVEASSGAGLPKMPWYGTADAYLRQTRQELEAVRRDLKKTEKIATTLLREAWFELDRAIREEALYRDQIVRRSKAVLDVSTRGYESGNVTFADVISSYTLWLQTNLTMENKRTGIGIARAELERAVGTAMQD